MKDRTRKNAVVNLVADGREFEIDDDVWSAWQQNARAFESPNDVLRRVFALDTELPDTHSISSAPSSEPRSRRANKGRRQRAASDSMLPESEYEEPILRAIALTGGSRPTRDILDAVGTELADRFLPADLEPLPKTGGIRWQNRVQFVRMRLVREGFLKSDSPRGVWEISSSGERRLGKSAA